MTSRFQIVRKFMLRFWDKEALILYKKEREENDFSFHHKIATL